MVSTWFLEFVQCREHSFLYKTSQEKRQRILHAKGLECHRLSCPFQDFQRSLILKYPIAPSPPPHKDHKIRDQSFISKATLWWAFDVFVCLLACFCVLTGTTTTTTTTICTHTHTQFRVCTLCLTSPLVSNNCSFLFRTHTHVRTRGSSRDTKKKLPCFHVLYVPLGVRTRDMYFDTLLNRTRRNSSPDKLYFGK